MKSCSALGVTGFALLIMLNVANSFAQGGRDSLTMDMLVPQQAIKFSPMHLINFYPTVQLAFEQQIAPQVTLQLEGGYVLDYNNDWDDDFLNRRGVKGKLEGRYYFFGRQDRQKIYYMAGEVYANVINFDRMNSRQECYDLDCDHAFLRFEPYKVEYREKGFTLKVGVLRYVGRFIFDFNSGWTIRDINYNHPPWLPESFEEDWSFFDIPNERDRTVLSPNLGFRFGYKIK